MDVDIDGDTAGHQCDGDCQQETSFKDIVAGYDKGINDLNAYIHSYVVFGNQGKKKGYTTFDPTAYGIKPLSLMAVVCNNQLVSYLYAHLSYKATSDSLMLTLYYTVLWRLGRRKRR